MVDVDDVTDVNVVQLGDNVGDVDVVDDVYR